MKHNRYVIYYETREERDSIMEFMREHSVSAFTVALLRTMGLHVICDPPAGSLIEADAQLRFPMTYVTSYEHDDVL